MTKEREALKLAFDVLVEINKLSIGENAICLPAEIDTAMDAAKEVLAQPPEERNFCPRCGKRAGKNAWDVHTCSLPDQEPPPEYQSTADKSKLEKVPAKGTLLAQPRQEPTWWLVEYHDWAREFVTKKPEESIAIKRVTALYTTPPQPDVHANDTLSERVDEMQKQRHDTTPPQPETPPECQTEAEKKAFAFGWFKAMEAQRLAQPEQKQTLTVEQNDNAHPEYVRGYAAGLEAGSISEKKSAKPYQKDGQLVSNADELPNGFVPPKRGPVAFLVEGLHKGKVIAHQLYFTVEEAQKTVSVFAHHYPTVNIRSLIFGDTTPPQREWVGLTDEERLEAAEIDGADEWFWKVCKAIEAKLKEKNT